MEKFKSLLERIEGYIKRIEDDSNRTIKPLYNNLNSIKSVRLDKNGKYY